MRRTTIFRSNGRAVAVAVTALTVATVPSWGQEPTAAGQEREVHVVRLGETLWSLADYYLGDPLLWPEIYRRNTVVVEDPHWIFPGEQLRLSDLDSMQVAPEVSAPIGPQVAPPPPPPPPSGRPETIFARNRPRRGVRSATTSGARGEPALHRSTFYGAGFLTEEERLPWAEVLGSTSGSTLGTLTEGSSAMLFRRIHARGPEGATYQVGDSLLVARLDREVPGWGNVVVPTGIVRVTAVSGRDVEAQVVGQFDRVADGQVAIPVEPFSDQSSRQATVPIENGMLGTIITSRDRDLLPHQQGIVFIDRGRIDDVALGDIFEVYLPRMAVAEVGDRQVAMMRIVHVRDRSASGLLFTLSDVEVQPGTPVRLIRKMPS